MIRVLHVIGSMGSGGAEAMIMNYYRNIDRTQVQFDFVVHTKEKCFYDEEIERLGGRIYRTEKFNIVNIISYKMFWDKFYKEHPEYQIVHGHINSSAGIYLSLAKKYGRIAIVHSHSTRSPQISINAIAFRICSYPIRYIADYFFACSKKAGVDRFGKKVASSSRCQVMNNAIDVNNFSFNDEIRRTIRQQYNVTDEIFVVGHVGRFTFAKNHEFILKVFKKVHEKCEKSELWLIGEGELEFEIKDQVKRLKIEDSVRFIGVTREVHEYLMAMDVFVFPSIFEGLAISIIEAQAAGLPCVVSKCIQPEADMGADLIHMLDLSISTNIWANQILNLKDISRKKCEDYVRDAGFDIAKNALELQHFYIDLWEKLDA